MSPVPIYTPGWQETKWSKVPCLRKQHNRRGLNPRNPDPEFEVLTTRPHTPPLIIQWFCTIDHILYFITFFFLMLWLHTFSFVNNKVSRKEKIDHVTCTCRLTIIYCFTNHHAHKALVACKNFSAKSKGKQSKKE